MTFRKFILLVLIVGFGLTMEVAWRVREQVGFGPFGWQLIGGRFYGSSFAFDQQAREVLPAGTSLEVDNAFGAVRVRQGAAGEAQLTLHKLVFRPDEGRARAFAEKIQLQHSVTNGVLRVTTNRSMVEAQDPSVGFHTHLELVVPPGTPVKVTNEHGAVEVVDAASADVTASFDDVRLDRIAGDAVVESRHAQVVASAIGGRLKVTAQHDSVALSQVTGPVTLRSEHGSVTLTSVGSVDADVAFGQVEVDDVRGDLTLRGRHTGVRARRITGGASIETAYEAVSLQDVGGNAAVRVDHGGVEVTDVRGTLEASGSYESMRLSRIAGAVKIDVDHGGLQASSLNGGGLVNVSGDDVKIDGFSGALAITAQRASLYLTSRSPVTAALSASTTNGGIQLTVPSTSKVDVDASSNGGDATIGSGFTITRSDPSHVVGQLGGGGSLIKLEAERGDVTVETSAVTAQAETPVP